MDLSMAVTVIHCAADYAACAESQSKSSESCTAPASPKTLAYPRTALCDFVYLFIFKLFDLSFGGTFLTIS